MGRKKKEEKEIKATEEILAKAEREWAMKRGKDMFGAIRIAEQYESFHGISR